MKFKENLILIETHLGGKSRSGGTTNWNHYVVRGFDKSKEYIIVKDSNIYDESFNKIGELRKGDKINILEPELYQYKRSSFAKIKKLKNRETGLVNITSIQKPTTKIEGSVIPGGMANNKNFTPDILKLNGIKFKSVTNMASQVANSISSLYKGSDFNEIKKYLAECIKLSTGANVLIESGFSKSYQLSGDYNVVGRDVRILSKNFGEILAAMYILANNKKSEYVEFPADVSQELYDFLMVERGSGKTHYYSVKSHGGSSTSLGNINFILNHFSDTNVLFKENEHEVQVIRSLINNQKEGKTTLKNIENFYNTILSDKKRDIINRLGDISKQNPKDLSQKSLDVWFDDMIKSSTKEEFISTLQDIYDNVLGDKGHAPKATIKTLEQIYKDEVGSKYEHGYLYYPMGSYIVKYLNTTGKYLDILNVILNYGSYIHQFTVNMDIKQFDVSISSFKKTKFRFSYNAMSKKPSNRPIGFIKGN